MPGPISDSYDPEFSTGENARKVGMACRGVALAVTGILDGAERLHILELIQEGRHQRKIPAVLTEQQWRVIRFSLERTAEEL
jgi:hypothetical protein